MRIFYRAVLALLIPVLTASALPAVASAQESRLKLPTLATGVAMRVRSIQGGPLMQIPVFLLLFMAPVYVPLPLLSGWIHAVASVNPTTALLQAGRGFISGNPTGVIVAFGAAVGLALVFAFWARGGLRRAEAAS